MSATRTLPEIRAALEVERGYLDQIGFQGGVVPVAEIQARAGFFATNDERSLVEVADFRDQAPDRYFAYHDGHQPGSNPGRVGGTLTTWTGSELAVVIDRWAPFTSVLGDHRQNFRAIAINGEIYTATAYLSAGDYVRMRRVKPRDASEASRARRYAESKPDEARSGRKGTR